VNQILQPVIDIAPGSILNDDADSEWRSPDFQITESREQGAPFPKIATISSDAGIQEASCAGPPRGLEQDSRYDAPPVSYEP
jgi:hypothetical protein